MYYMALCVCVWRYESEFIFGAHRMNNEHIHSYASRCMLHTMSNRWFRLCDMLCEGQGHRLCLVECNNISIWSKWFQCNRFITKMKTEGNCWMENEGNHPTSQNNVRGHCLSNQKLGWTKSSKERILERDDKNQICWWISGFVSVLSHFPLQSNK